MSDIKKVTLKIWYDTKKINEKDLNELGEILEKLSSGNNKDYIIIIWNSEDNQKWPELNNFGQVIKGGE